MPEKITVPPVLKDARLKPPFDFDCVTKIPNVDPIAKTHAEFDWELLSTLLGETLDAEDELAAACLDADREKLCKAIAEIFQFVIKQKQLHNVGRRFVALAWVINPALFGGESAAQVAREFGLRPNKLQECTGDASGRFSIRNHAQAHAANFDPEKQS